MATVPEHTPRLKNFAQLLEMRPPGHPVLPGRHQPARHGPALIIWVHDETAFMPTT